MEVTIAKGKKQYIIMQINYLRKFLMYLMLLIKEKSDEFINFLSAFFQEVRVKQQNDLQQNILISLSNTSLTQLFILNTRKNILNKTDYLFIGDYPITEDQKSKWAEYRQQWRDITKQEAWKTDEIYKLNFSNFSSRERRFYS